MSAGRILIVDDDPRIQRMLGGQLAARGYDVRAVASGPDALVALAEEEPDLVLLDISMPGMDGLEICRQLREWSSVPVIFLTASDTPERKIEGLSLGADDYLTKPFHMGELLARIAAVRRRAAASAQSTPGIVSVGDLVIDLTRREVRRGEEEIRLTRKEFDLLQEFVIHADRVLTYSHLLNAVWGPGYDDPHLVQVHVGNLRRKLQQGSSGRRLILPLSGIGYRLRTGA